MKLPGWWKFCLFISLCYLLFTYCIQGKREELARAVAKAQTLKEEERVLKRECSDLREEIANQDDPAWQELVLQKKLGLVPEGEIKVTFDPT